jgi:hypothetical protein
MGAPISKSARPDGRRFIFNRRERTERKELNRELSPEQILNVTLRLHLQSFLACSFVAHISILPVITHLAREDEAAKFLSVFLGKFRQANCLWQGVNI